VHHKHTPAGSSTWRLGVAVPCVDPPTAVRPPWSSKTQGLYLLTENHYINDMIFTNFFLPAIDDWERCTDVLRLTVYSETVKLQSYRITAPIYFYTLYIAWIRRCTLLHITRSVKLLIMQTHGWPPTYIQQDNTGHRLLCLPYWAKSSKSVNNWSSRPTSIYHGKGNK